MWYICFVSLKILYMNSNIPLEYKIALGQIPRVGDNSARKLVAFFGSVEAIFTEKYSSLIKIQGIGETLARYISDKTYLDIAKQEAEYVTKNNIKTYFYLDDDYPVRLSQCEDSPVVFFYKGNADLNSQKILSVVGTRNATSRGKDICDKIIGELAQRHPNLLIASGLAYGIDVAAHKAALRHNLPTVGVLGHGFQIIYPAEHRPIADEMIENGGIISDFLHEEQPERNNFIKRNRIIAEMSDATLVVESGVKGGSLITAEIASSYNRDVFAVPGRPDDIYSAGCNNLIRNNKAALVECANDIEYFMQWDAKKKQPVQRQLFVEMNMEEQSIYNIIAQEGEANIDAICRASGIPINKLSAILLQMEMKGVVISQPANIYKITS